MCLPALVDRGHSSGEIGKRHIRDRKAVIPNFDILHNRLKPIVLLMQVLRTIRGPRRYTCAACWVHFFPFCWS
jgi:hypothetical protein